MEEARALIVKEVPAKAKGGAPPSAKAAEPESESEDGRGFDGGDGDSGGSGGAWADSDVDDATFEGVFSKAELKAMKKEQAQMRADAESGAKLELAIQREKDITEAVQGSIRWSTTKVAKIKGRKITYHDCYSRGKEDAAKLATARTLGQ